MVNAVAFPALDRGASRRVRSYWREQVSPLVALVPDAVLLGLLRAWSFAIAPKHGLYFTAEAALIVYACFAIVRAVHIHALGHDRLGRYDPERARQAKHAFYAALGRRWTGVALLVLPLFLAALVLDVLTADTGVQHRLNVHLSVMFVELMAWWRYGSAIVVASGLWAPSRPPAFARARVLVGKAQLRVARSLTPAHGILCAAALAGLAVYAARFGGPMLGITPNARLVLACSAALCAGLAWLALISLCRETLAVVARIREQGVRGARLDTLRR